MLIRFLLLLLSCTFVVSCTDASLEVTTRYNGINYLQSGCPYEALPNGLSQQNLQEALTLPNTQKNRAQMIALIQLLANTTDTLYFSQLSQKALAYAQDQKDIASIASVHSAIANYKAIHDEFDQALMHSNWAKEYYINLNQIDNVAQMNGLQGFLLFEQGLISEAQDKAQSALMLLDAITTPSYARSQLYELLGYCMMTKENYSRALEFFTAQKNELVLINAQCPSLDLEQEQIMCLSNLALTNFRLQNYEQAQVYTDLGLRSLQRNHFPILESYLSTTKARTDYQLTKNTENIAIIENNYVYDSLYTNSFKQFDTAMSLAEIYKDTQQYDLATQWATKAYQVALKHKIESLARQSLEFILLLQNSKDPVLVNKLIVLNKEINKKQYKIKENLRELNINTRRVYQENNRLKNTLITLSISLVFLSLCGFIFYILKRAKAKNKALIEQQLQQQANEEIYNLIIQKNDFASGVKQNERKRIAKELHDGLVNNIFTIRFNLQQIESDNESLKATLIQELHHIERTTQKISHTLEDTEVFKDHKFTTLIDELTRVKQQSSTLFTYCFKNKNDTDLEYLSAHEKVNIYYMINQGLDQIASAPKGSRATAYIFKAQQTCYIRLAFKAKVTTDMSASDSMLNISQRAQSIGAKIRIKVTPTKGWSILITLPLAQQ